MPRKIELRTENDSFGSTSVPANVYWGAQTARALESAIKIPEPNPRLLEAVLLVHKAGTLASLDALELETACARAISQAVDETLAGQWQNQFVVNLMQPTALRDFICNIREFLANRAGEILGSAPGSYKLVHPELHAGAGRSPQQDFAMALRVALLYLSKDLDTNLKDMERLLRRKALEFERLNKNNSEDTNRAEQRLSAVLNAFGFEISKICKNFSSMSQSLLEVPLKTAPGTTSSARSEMKVIEKLAFLSNLSLKPANCLGQAHLFYGDYMAFSSELKLLALTMQSLSAELKLFLKNDEISFSPGASANNTPDESPILDFAIAVSCQVIGGDSVCAGIAQQVNVQADTKMSILAHNLLQNMELLRQTVSLFNRRCIYDMDINLQKPVSTDFRAVSRV